MQCFSKSSVSPERVTLLHGADTPFGEAGACSVQELKELPFSLALCKHQTRDRLQPCIGSYLPCLGDTPTGVCPKGESNFTRDLMKGSFKNVTSFDALNVIYSYSWSWQNEDLVSYFLCFSLS